MSFQYCMSMVFSFDDMCQAFLEVSGRRETKVKVGGKIIYVWWNIDVVNLV